MASTSSTQCGICGVHRKEPYTCPRCSILYCSIACYRSTKHTECSEKFYQEQVQRELSGKRAADIKDDDYKEKLQKFLEGDWSGLDEPEQEQLDSDDDVEGENEDVAMKKMVEGAIDDYEMEEGELERRMLAAGLSDDVDELLNTLTEEERNAFRTLASEMQQEELGLADSCFSGKRN